MATIPDAPRTKTEPSKGFKNGCLGALVWGGLLAVLVAALVYFFSAEVAEETKEEVYTGEPADAELAPADPDMPNPEKTPELVEEELPEL